MTTSVSTPSMSASAVPTGRLPAPVPLTPVARERRHRVLRRLANNRLGLAGGGLVLIIALAAVAAPLVSPHNPDQVNLALRTKPPGTSGYVLGTDIFGRDLLSRIIWGGRVSLTMGLAAMALSATVGITLVILEAASLSFLGLGAQPPTAEWGAMLSEARQYVTVAPHVVLIPGVAILLVVVGLNLLGDALRDAFDIRLQET